MDSFDLPAVGTRIDDANNAEAGQILNACLNPDSKVEALAVLKSTALDSALKLANNGVQILELPYSTDNE